MHVNTCVHAYKHTYLNTCMGTHIRAYVHAEAPKWFSGINSLKALHLLCSPIIKEQQTQLFHKDQTSWIRKLNRPSIRSGVLQDMRVLAWASMGSGLI